MDDPMNLNTATPAPLPCLAVALSGKLEVSAYTAKDGSPAAGLSVVCDELAALKAKPRPKPSPAPAPVAAGFDDDLPDWCA